MNKQKKNSELDNAIARLIAAGATNLTEQARDGHLRHAYGRDKEIEGVLAALSDRRNVLLLGPSGVGKTAVLHEVIIRIARGQVPAPLCDKHVFQISTGTIESGAMNAGMWSAKLREVVDALIAGKHIYLYLDNIWHLRDAGRYTGEIESFATYLRPYLEHKDVILLGESTPEYYRRSSAHGLEAGLALADDHSLLRLFEVISIEEPDPTSTRAILSSVALDLERAHDVQIPGAVIERSLELTRRFMPYRFFPGKAIHLLEEVARGQRPGATADPASKGSVGAGEETVVTPEMVLEAFTNLTGLPQKIFSDAIPLKQDEIRTYFAERVVGQETAVNAIVDLVTMVKAELNDPARPLGVLVFVGPTGTGKTLMARTLAEYLFGSAQRVVRFDMSEYQHPDSLPGLAQQLVEKLRQESFAVLLLDEVEKASYGAFDLLLQAFDAARLTDPSGRVVDLRNTIIILTSNLGGDTSGSPRSRPIGFLAVEDPTPEQHELQVRAVLSYFRPEFVNRLDKIVAFRSLDVQDMRRIARRELGKALLREGMTRRNILLDFREEVLDTLVAAGFSAQYGARHLQRAIKELVLLPLARRIAAKPGQGNLLLELRAEGGRIDIARIPVSVSEPEEIQEEPAPGLAEGTRAGTLSLDKLAAAIDALRERLAGLVTSPRFRTLEARSAELLQEIAQPTFWDDPDRSRAVLGTVHHLERLTDLLTELRSRADALGEIPTLIKRHRRPSDIVRLSARYETLLNEVALAELELLACNVDAIAASGAFINIHPLMTAKFRDAGDWPTTLRDMYTGWAQRKGYEVESVNERGSTSLLLVVRGPGTAAMLRGETGIHKRQTQSPPPNDHRRPDIQLARVEVLPLELVARDRLPFRRDEVAIGEIGQDVSGEDRGRMVRVVEAWHRASNLRVRVAAADAEQLALALLVARLTVQGTVAGPDTEPARVYNCAHRQYVRDPRTGERTGRVRDVLAGDIDRFLLAFLQQQGAPASPEPVVAGLV